MNIHSVSPAATSTKSGASADKREAILAAALALFAERTFDGTAVPLIAERAGVAAGTIYRYFDGKEALVNALYRRWKSELRDTLAGAVATGGTHEERFRLMWGGLWRFASSEPQALAFLETQHHESYLDDESRALAASIDAAAVAYVKGAQDEGAIRQAPPGMLLALVFGAFVGIVKQAGPGGLPYDEAAMRASADVMWSALRSRAGDERGTRRKESK
jgi:TetR/AcrR family transcriptional regulator, repressor of fatR-cypB operon